MKKLGVVVFIIGVAMLLGSFYIKTQVLEGRKQISSAQKSVDQSKGLFSLSPYTKDVGGMIAGSAENKIKAGSAEADRYEKIAGGLQIGGGALIILGIVLLVIRKKR